MVPNPLKLVRDLGPGNAPEGYQVKHWNPRAVEVNSVLRDGKFHDDEKALSPLGPDETNDLKIAEGKIL